MPAGHNQHQQRPWHSNLAHPSTHMITEHPILSPASRPGNKCHTTPSLNPVMSLSLTMSIPAMFTSLARAPVTGAVVPVNTKEKMSHAGSAATNPPAPRADAVRHHHRRHHRHRHHLTPVTHLAVTVSTQITHLRAPPQQTAPYPLLAPSWAITSPKRSKRKFCVTGLLN